MYFSLVKKKKYNDIIQTFKLHIQAAKTMNAKIDDYVCR